MKFDELYKFLGYCLVCLLILYIMARSVRFQLGLIEGLVGVKRPVEAQKSAEAEDEAEDEDEGEDEDEE